MDGPLKGTKLKFLPGTVTTWKDWRTRHPETTVLDLERTDSKYARYVYADGTDFVFGVKLDGVVKAYPYKFLAEHPIVNDRLGQTPVVVAFDPGSTRAFLHARRAGARELKFNPSYAGGLLVDQQTGTRWDPWTGDAVEGELKGQKLRPLYGILSYLRAWKIFYPNTEIAGQTKGSALE